MFKFGKWPCNIRFLLNYAIFFIWLRTLCSGLMLTNENTVTIQEIVGNDLFFEIVDPKELAYTYKIRPAQDFGLPFNSSFVVRNTPLMLTDPPTACGHIINQYAVLGNVALVQRGECSFLSKAVQAQKAGAIAMIVTDDDKDNDDVYIEMVDDNTFREVNIPAGFILGKNGYVIIKTLEKLQRKHAVINLPINVTNLALHKLNQPPWINW